MPKSSKLFDAAPVRRWSAPEQTRLRIIQAYGDEISRGDDGDLTVQRVAARAGVSVPTLYRNFASLDALGDAYWAWVEPQIGTFDSIKNADDLPSFAEGVFRRFAEHESLIRAMFASRSGRRLRDRTVGRRNQEFQRALAPLTKRMPEREALAVTALCKIMSGGYVWMLMHKDWGLDGAESGRAVAWAMRVLIQALRDNPKPFAQQKGS